MACNLLFRLFGRRRTSRLPVSANTTYPPALPVHSNNPMQLEQSLKQLELNDQTQDDLLSLGCLPGEGSYILSILDIPFGANNASIQSLQDLPGFIRFEAETSNEPTASTDVFLHFSTAAEAANAMASNQTLNIDNTSIRRLQPDHRDSESDEPAAKRQKAELVDPPPKCLVCCEELPGPHARPCLNCDRRWCYDCLKTHFAVALNDTERFPSQCCGRIVHYDVARGIMSTADHSKYRTRFEEHSSTKPVYCANPICSAFLPPRLAKPDNCGRVLCTSCQSVTCSECREVVHPTDAGTHACTAADQITALIAQFEYKRCPRCNTGVAKMYGCSHIRCQCGAHWCWDCERAIHICWAKPCERAREDGDMTDDNGLPAEESDSDDDSTVAGSTEDLVQPPVPAQNVGIEPLVPIGAQSVDSIPAAGDEGTQQTITRAGQSLNAQLDSTEEFTQAQPSTRLGQEEDGLLIEQHGLVLGAVSQDESLNTNESSTELGDIVVEPTLATANNSSGNPAPVLGIPNGHVEATDVIADSDSAPPADTTAAEYRPPAALSTTPVLPPTQIPSEPTEPFINLDAEDQDNWQGGEFDFGDEPLDETWDTWGCLHHFAPLHNSKMHQYWLPTRRTDTAIPQIAKQIDCLRCYKTITLREPTVEEKVEAERKDSGVELPFPHNQQADEIPNTQDIASQGTELQQNSKRKGRNKKDVSPLKVFNCTQCGVIFCTSCKKSSMRELRALRENNTVRI